MFKSSFQGKGASFHHIFFKCYFDPRPTFQIMAHNYARLCTFERFEWSISIKANQGRLEILNWGTLAAFLIHEYPTLFFGINHKNLKHQIKYQRNNWFLIGEYSKLHCSYEDKSSVKMTLEAYFGKSEAVIERLAGVQEYF